MCFCWRVFRSADDRGRHRRDRKCVSEAKLADGVAKWRTSARTSRYVNNWNDNWNWNCRTADSGSIIQWMCTFRNKLSMFLFCNNYCFSRGNNVIETVSRNGMYVRRMLFPVCRNAQFCCHYCVSLCDVDVISEQLAWSVIMGINWPNNMVGWNWKKFRPFEIFLNKQK